MASSTRAVAIRGLVAAASLGALLCAPAVTAAPSAATKKKRKPAAVSLISSVVHDATVGADDCASAALMLKRRAYVVGYTTGVDSGNNATLTDFSSKLVVGGSLGRDVAGEDDRFDAVAVNALGEIYAAGFASRADNGRDIYVQKFHAKPIGHAQSAIVGTDFGDDAAHGIAVASDGTVFVVGEQALPGGATWLWFGKFDADLGVIDQSSYFGPLELGTTGRAIAIDSAGDLIVAGAVPREGTGDDIWVGKFDTSFNMKREAYVAGAGDGDDAAYALTIDRSGRIWVCGTIATAERGRDVWLGGFDADLEPLGDVTHSVSTTGDDAAQATVADRRGHLFLAGRAAHAGGGYVPWVGVFDTRLQAVADTTYDALASPRADDHDGGRGLLLLPKNVLVVTGGVTEVDDDGAAWLARFKAKRLPKVKSKTK